MKWLNNILYSIEDYYNIRIDKLIHFFVMSLLVLPVSLVWHCWWLTLLAAAFGATAKELIDVQYRGKQWDWFDWLYGAMAGIVQSIILIP